MVLYSSKFCKIVSVKTGKNRYDIIQKIKHVFGNAWEEKTLRCDFTLESVKILKKQIEEGAGV